MLQQRTRVVSIDQEVGEEGGETLERLLSDASAVTPEQRLLNEEGRRNLIYALSKLPDRERMILARRFGLGGASGGSGETLNDIATRVGLSRERVRQIESQARERLRKLLSRRGRSPNRSQAPSTRQEVD